ncbi:hypothetical protein TIFTF001_031251 [Ficus carica]|uniref:Uncharacterized protein n=1 Tax=Ficus carica TaxID=3494 RepID=A0AA88DV05_FICCA|nr:hypothetical protein TIFTF001_031251 [Ficus carica]
MVRPRVAATRVPQDVEMAELIANLQARLYAQEQENQGITVTEACQKFNRLARLCPYLLPTKGERVRRMIQMFRPEIVVVVDNGDRPPLTVAECVSRALRAEFHLTEAKEEKTR